MTQKCNRCKVTLDIIKFDINPNKNVPFKMCKICKVKAREYNEDNKEKIQLNKSDSLQNKLRENPNHYHDSYERNKTNILASQKIRRDNATEEKRAKEAKRLKERAERLKKEADEDDTTRFCNYHKKAHPIEEFNGEETSCRAGLKTKRDRRSEKHKRSKKVTMEGMRYCKPCCKEHHIEDFDKDSKGNIFSECRKIRTKKRILDKKYKEDNPVLIKKLSELHGILHMRNRNIYHSLIGCTTNQIWEWFSYVSNNVDTFSKEYETDHFIPQNAFDLEDEVDLYKCYNWKNLQRLEILNNQKKGRKIPSKEEIEERQKMITQFIELHPNMK
jgi:hypothetical protein